MRVLRRVLIVLAAAAMACDRPQGGFSPAALESPAPLSIAAASTPPSAAETFFDPSTVAVLMTARAAYDEAETAALRERERIIGNYRDVMRASREQVRRQLAGERIPAPRSEAWYIEQRRRNEYAASVTEPKIKAAQDALRRATLDALTQFFAHELAAGRIANVDYLRYTREIRAGYLPPFRGRKWSGSAVYEWRGGDVGPEYRRVLREVRRLWQAQAWARSAIVSHRTDQEFYRTLVTATKRDASGTGDPR